MANKNTRAGIRKAPLLNLARLAEDFGNTLVLAPHPDDEALGCGGFIALMTAKKVRVKVIFMTSGTASHTSKTHPVEALAKLREKEALSSCETLGINVNAVEFLRQQDSGLSSLNDEELEQLATHLQLYIEKNKIKTLLLPWRKDPHPDHIITSKIGQLAISKLEAPLIILEYPIWLWKNGDPEDYPDMQKISPFRLDISSVKELKWKAIHCHQSQLGKLIFDDPNGFILTEDLLKPFTGDYEYFFTEITGDRKSLGENYFDRLYENNPDPWNFKESPYEHEKYKVSVEALGNAKFKNALELGCSIGVQTKLLSQLSEKLLAIDINSTAIEMAKKTCLGIDNIRFKVEDITKTFPQGSFDLITCCEMAYYLSMEELQNLFRNIEENLVDGGKFLMVHWTGFVPDYPLTGEIVHHEFERFILKNGLFQEIEQQETQNYILQVWQKNYLNDVT
ncbi:bifunctional PIG-L family deacetylase/class I SAM-dependent methyltransferase [Gramella sp. AN32]|uniref:PIG-L family deacetylase n=1 Tax=Christiangramia antarctica TaxID=2058158 RepID=A0ABW5XB63_9FLAO|nr:bifunctional PIG-L family deacetylase/class I SAM-dependent methyltransferase [Gramella sp. AN32]MCM4157334.1 hypothetical protein [Gramella sp. AN32]